VLLSTLKAVFIVFFLVGSILHVTAAEVDYFSLSGITGVNKQNATPKTLRLAVITQYQDKDDFGLMQRIELGEQESKVEVFRIDCLRRGGETVAGLNFNDWFPNLSCDSRSEYYTRNSLVIALEFLMAALPLFPENVDNSVIREKIVAVIKYFLMNLCFEEAEEAEAELKDSPSEAAAEPNLSTGVGGNSWGFTTLLSWLPYNRDKSNPIVEAVVSPSPTPSSQEAAEAAEAELKDPTVGTTEAVDSFQSLLKGREFNPCSSYMQGEERAIYNAVTDAVKLIARNNLYKNTQKDYSTKGWEDYFTQQCSIHHRKPQQHKIKFMASKAAVWVEFLQGGSSKNPFEDYFLLSGIAKVDQHEATPGSIRLAIINNYHNKDDFGLLERLEFEGEEGKEEIFRIDSLRRWGEAVAQRDPTFTDFVLKIPCDKNSQYYTRLCFVSALDFLMATLTSPLLPENVGNNAAVREKLVTSIKYFLMNLCFEKAKDEGKFDSSAPQQTKEEPPAAGSHAEVSNEQLNTPAAEASLAAPSAEDHEPSTTAAAEPSTVMVANEDGSEAKAASTFQLLEGKQFDAGLNDIQDKAGIEKTVIYDIVMKALYLIGDNDFNKNTQGNYTVDYWRDYFTQQCLIYGREPQKEMINSMALREFIFIKSFQAHKINVEMGEAMNLSRMSSEAFKSFINKTNKEIGGNIDNIAKGSINLIPADGTGILNSVLSWVLGK